MGAMSTAVVFEQPGEMRLRPVELPEPHSTDCVVEVHWTGISTGTERLLWDGRMPPFPGLAYPLVPGYESVVASLPAVPRLISKSDSGSSCPAVAALPVFTGCSAAQPDHWLSLLNA